MSTGIEVPIPSEFAQHQNGNGDASSAYLRRHRRRQHVHMLRATPNSNLRRPVTPSVIADDGGAAPIAVLSSQPTTTTTTPAQTVSSANINKLKPDPNPNLKLTANNVPPPTAPGAASSTGTGNVAAKPPSRSPPPPRRKRQSPSEAPDMAPPGTILKKVWVVEKRLGAGGFGQVVLAIHSGSGARVAIKCENNTRKKGALKMEVAVLRELNGQAGVASYYGCGRAPGFNYVIMSLLGESISAVRKRLPGRRFDPYCGLVLAAKMLRCIRTVHNAGILHRDIKPSNFCSEMVAKTAEEKKKEDKSLLLPSPALAPPPVPAQSTAPAPAPARAEMATMPRPNVTKATGETVPTGPTTAAPVVAAATLDAGVKRMLEAPVYILDFGLARLYRTAEGDVRTPRKRAGFRGTARYASPNAHTLCELGRRDDLWSWWYSVLELLAGSLPWRRIKDRVKVGLEKSEWSPSRLCTELRLHRQLRATLQQIGDTISCLSYADEPPYDLFIDTLQSLAIRYHRAAAVALITDTNTLTSAPTAATTPAVPVSALIGVAEPPPVPPRASITTNKCLQRRRQQEQHQQQPQIHVQTQSEHDAATEAAEVTGTVCRPAVLSPAMCTAPVVGLGRAVTEQRQDDIGPEGDNNLYYRTSAVHVSLVAAGRVDADARASAHVSISEDRASVSETPDGDGDGGSGSGSGGGDGGGGSSGDGGCSNSSSSSGGSVSEKVSNVLNLNPMPVFSEVEAAAAAAAVTVTVAAVEQVLVESPVDSVTNTMAAATLLKSSPSASSSATAAAAMVPRPPRGPRPAHLRTHRRTARRFRPPYT
eukprot:UC1_evm2s1960